MTQTAITRHSSKTTTVLAILLSVVALAGCGGTASSEEESRSSRLSAPDPVFRGRRSRRLVGKSRPIGIPSQDDATVTLDQRTAPVSPPKSAAVTLPAVVPDEPRPITDAEFAASLPKTSDLDGGNVATVEGTPAQSEELVTTNSEPAKPSGKLVALTADNFGSVVTHGDKPVFVKYGFDSCYWCRVMAPVVAALAKRQDLAGVVIADSDIQHPRPAPQPEGGGSYPAFAYFKGGKVVHIHMGLGLRQEGGESKAAFELRLEEHFAKLIIKHLLEDPAASQGRTFGIIINGDGEAHHTGNVSAVRSFFKSYYGIATSDLYLLSPDQKHAAVRKNIFGAAEALSARIGPRDRLVIYTTGHGVRTGGKTHLVLQGGQRISDAEFSRAFLDNRAAEVVYIGDQCYSGGFTSAMTSSGKKVLAMSASDSSHTTYCQTFIKPWLAAFRDSSNDTNNDGRVDETEAFVYARRRHRQSLDHASANAQYQTSGYGPG